MRTLYVRQVAAGYEVSDGDGTHWATTKTREQALAFAEAQRDRGRVAKVVDLEEE